MRRSTGPKNNHHGLSLIEVLVVMVIFTILTAMVFVQFRMGWNLWDIGTAHLNSQQYLRAALGWIKNDLRQSGRGAIVDVPSDGNWYPAITFRKVAGVQNSQAVWDVTATRYYLDDQKRLVRQEGEGSLIVAEEIGSVAFRRAVQEPGTVEARIASDRVSSQPGVKENLSITVKLRN